MTREFPPELIALEEHVRADIAANFCSAPAKMKRLYEVADLLFAFVAKYVPCHQGCTACCYYNVDVSDTEARLIEEAYGMNKPSLLPPAVRPYGTPCPFLVGDACSIYPWRPFLCRRFVSLDDSPFWCAHERAAITEMKLLHLTGLEMAYCDLVASDSKHDIRSLFPLGLQTRPPAGSRG